MKKAIGIDLGGTKIEAALVDEEGKVHDSIRLSTDSEKGPEAVFENLKKCVEEVNQEGIVGIGMGTPGFVYKGRTYSSENLPGLMKIINLFLKEYPDAKIDNDANCFALAEHEFGAARGRDNVLGIIWGTGIGSGIILDGKLVHGATGGAGEVGMMTIDKSIESFETSGPGTWEYYCSGPNIARRYEEKGGKIKDARPDEIFDSGEEAAEEVKEETLHCMGLALGNLVNIFNPELIVLGGGVSNLDVYEELNKRMKNHSLPASGEVCEVVKNKRGDSAGVLGAAALVFER